MKRIQYNGTSSIISRIVYLLNRKAPLPLDGQGDAEWGTSGQVLTTDGQGNTSWTTPQGGGGDVTDVEVNGTSVVNAQGVAEVSVPTKTSDLTNDSGFITNLVNNLANYYTKSQTYTQAEVDALISGIVTLNILVVQTLPTQDISTTTIYLVPKQDTGTSDIYDEYLYINNAWELIGTTQIDLSNYVTTTDLSTALSDYVTSVGLATILAGYVQSSDLGDGTLTIQQNGTTLGTFTANQSGNTTVNLTGGGSTYTEGDGIDISSQNVISVDTTFTEASTRANIASGDSFSTILGKIKKFFTDLKTVAFSGSYNDLSDKPTIPAAQVNSDWNASSGVAQILNKPTIPSLDDVKTLKNYYDSRPTSANLQFGDGRLRQFKATSSMTTGKPDIGDAHIIHMAWDNNGGLDAELAVGINGGMMYRRQNYGTWQAWKRLIDSDNIGSQSVNYANSAGSATTSSKSNWLNGSSNGDTPYVSSDTHIMQLGYFTRSSGFNNSTILVTSAFWGNQHGSADIINMNQDSNGSNTQDLWRVRISDKSNRKFYYAVANDRIYLYAYVTGGNQYGRWNVTELQGSSNTAHWVSEFLYNQSSGGLTEIGFSGQVGYASSAGSVPHDTIAVYSPVGYVIAPNATLDAGIFEYAIVSAYNNDQSTSTPVLVYENNTFTMKIYNATQTFTVTSKRYIKNNSSANYLYALCFKGNAVWH